jgi:hypothetical protein
LRKALNEEYQAVLSPNEMVCTILKRSLQLIFRPEVSLHEQFSELELGTSTLAINAYPMASTVKALSTYSGKTNNYHGAWTGLKFVDGLSDSRSSCVSFSQTH